LKKSNIATIVALPMAFIAIVFTIMNIEYLIRTFVRSGSFFYLVFAICLIIFESIVELLRNKRIKTLLNNLKYGVPIKHKVKYKKTYANTILKLAFILMNVIYVFSILYFSDSIWDRSVENYNGILPTATIYELDKDCIIEDDYRFDDINHVNYNNFFSHARSDLAPEILTIEQEGSVKGEMWEDNSGEYTPNITTDYYRLRFKFLRSAFVKDLIAYDAEFYKYKETTSEEILDTDFDYAYLVREKETQYLYAYKDNKVVEIRYQGYGDLKEHIEDIEDRVENFNGVGER